MKNEESFYLIALLLLKGIGLQRAKNLISYIGKDSISDIFSSNIRNLAEIPCIGNTVASQLLSSAKSALKRAEEEMKFVNQNKIDIITYLDDVYPVQLKECPDAPLYFFSKGNINFNQGKFISFVGTRNATMYGKERTESLIKQLAEKHPDVCIVSGLAYGIDIIAHKAALKNELNTIAVLGHGLDRIYPAIHRNIAVDIVKNGTLISEFMSNTEPDKQNFVKRNRIVAGISSATVIIESASKGGALITAELANSYNKDVFAVPGRIGDEWSAGCNKLIKENKAALVESAVDIDYITGWENNASKKNPSFQPQLAFPMTEEEQLIFSCLDKEGALNINQLSAFLNIPVALLSPLLLEMEFKGLVKCFPGNMYQRY